MGLREDVKIDPYTRDGKFRVYVLACTNDRGHEKYYVGCTSRELNARFREHVRKAKLVVAARSKGTPMTRAWIR